MKMRRISKTLGLTALAITAFCAMAGAAQGKAWILQHTAMPSANSFTQGGTFTLKVKARGLELKCSVSGSGTATPSSTLSDEFALSGCQPYHYESSTLIPCTAKWLKSGSLAGTAESAALSTMTLELTGAECPLTKINELKGVTLGLSYGAEGIGLGVSGSSTTGTFGSGNYSTSSTFSGVWSLSGTNSGKTWGWGEPMFGGPGSKWYVNGALLTTNVTLAKEGTMVLEIPGNGTVITCGETAVAELGPSGLLIVEATLSSCKLKGYETRCTISPMEYTNKSEILRMYASGPECPLFKETNYVIPAFGYAFGPESVNLTNIAWGTGKYGANTMYWNSSTTWRLTGAKYGLPFGFH